MRATIVCALASRTHRASRNAAAQCRAAAITHLPHNISFCYLPLAPRQHIAACGASSASVCNRSSRVMASSYKSVANPSAEAARNMPWRNRPGAPASVISRRTRGNKACLRHRVRRKMAARAARSWRLEQQQSLAWQISKRRGANINRNAVAHRKYHQNNGRLS